MKRIFSFIWIFSILSFLIFFISCGQIKGGGPYDIGHGGMEDGVGLAGRSYGINVQLPDGQIINNYIVIRFVSPNEWVGEVKINSNSYVAMMGIYSFYSDTGRVLLEVRNIDERAIPNLPGDIRPGAQLQFTLTSGGNSLVDQYGEVWHKL